MQLPVQLLRKSDTHKRDYGHVFVIGGSVGLTGAVCLSAKAALRAGAGLVTVGVPETLNSIFEIKLTEVMSLPLESDGKSLSLKALSKIKGSLNKINSIILGPGASCRSQTQKLINRIIGEVDKPIIVDADGINALATNLKILEKRKTKNIILTPHLGEFARLLGIDAKIVKKKRKELAKGFALRYNLTLALKGHRTIVTDGENVFENVTGNPGLATAGSGDVLAGIIAALVAQGLDCFEAAKFGVYIHGLAADCAVKEKTEICLIASDVINYLPLAVQSLVNVDQ